MSNKHSSTRNPEIVASVEAANYANTTDFKTIGNWIRPIKVWSIPGGLTIVTWPRGVSLVLVPNGDLFLVDDEMGYAFRVTACVEVLLDVFEPHIGRLAIQRWERRVAS